MSSIENRINKIAERYVPSNPRAFVYIHYRSKSILQTMMIKDINKAFENDLKSCLEYLATTFPEFPAPLPIREGNLESNKTGIITYYRQAWYRSHDMRRPEDFYGSYEFHLKVSKCVDKFLPTSLWTGISKKYNKIMAGIETTLQPYEDIPAVKDLMNIINPLDDNPIDDSEFPEIFKELTEVFNTIC